MKRSMFLSIGFLFILTQLLLAQIPKTLSYQGLLTNATGEIVADGDYAIKFTIYDAVQGGTNLWSEEHPTVSIQSGVFNAVLGSITPFDTLAFNKQYWLGISVNGGEELTPRVQLTASAYSMSTFSVNGDVLKVDGHHVYFPHSRITDFNDRMEIDPYNDRMILWDNENSMSFEVYHGNNDLDVRLKAGGENSWVSAVNKGNFGIGTQSPQKLLDVNGDAHVRGKLTSGDANISLPIAYGAIKLDGSIKNASSNVTGSVWNSSENRYEITIDNFSFNWRYHVTQITPFASGTPKIANVLTIDAGGKIPVYIFDLDGNSSQSPFYFVVYEVETN